MVLRIPNLLNTKLAMYLFKYFDNVNNNITKTFKIFVKKISLIIFLLLLFLVSILWFNDQKNLQVWAFDLLFQIYSVIIQSSPEKNINDNLKHDLFKMPDKEILEQLSACYLHSYWDRNNTDFQMLTELFSSSLGADSNGISFILSRIWELFFASSNLTLQIWRNFILRPIICRDE